MRVTPACYHVTVGTRLDDDLDTWLRVGRMLKAVDRERYLRVLSIAQQIVDAHVGEISGIVVGLPNVDSSTDVS